MSIKTDTVFNLAKNLDPLFENPYTFKFQLSDLPPVMDLHFPDIRHLSPYQEFFHQLDQFTNDCLYWIKLDSLNHSQMVKDRYQDIGIHLHENYRVHPPLSRYDTSTCLYVGIRRGGIRERDGLSNIAGRMVQHFGYYDKGSTQGLQLAHWPDKMKLTISIHIVHFDDNLGILLKALECYAAHKFQPILGRH